MKVHLSYQYPVCPLSEKTTLAMFAWSRLKNTQLKSYANL